MMLAYIDLRPFLFAGGLTLFVGLSLLVACMANRRVRKAQVTLYSALLFTALFTFFLTEFGPFCGRVSTCRHSMNWQIDPHPPSAHGQAEVVLSFADAEGHYVGEFSDQLADHLRKQGQQPVQAIFEVTRDYGRMRGFRMIEVEGLRGWTSRWGYAGATGTPARSPWD